MPDASKDDCNTFKSGKVEIDEKIKRLDLDVRARSTCERAVSLHLQQQFAQRPGDLEALLPEPLLTSEDASFVEELLSVGILQHAKDDHKQPNNSMQKTPDEVVAEQFDIALSQREQRLGDALKQMGTSLEREMGALQEQVSELAGALAKERSNGQELTAELKCSQMELGRTGRERDDARTILAQARGEVVRETEQLSSQSQKLCHELSSVASDLAEEREEAQTLRAQLRLVNRELEDRRNLSQSLKDRLLAVSSELHEENVESKCLRDRLSCSALCSDAQSMEQHDEAYRLREQVSHVEGRLAEELTESKQLRRQLSCTEAELAGERAVRRFESAERNSSCAATSAFDARMTAMEAALVAKDPALAALVGTIGRSLMRELSSATQTVAEAEDMLAQRKLALSTSTDKDQKASSLELKGQLAGVERPYLSSRD